MKPDQWLRGAGIAVVTIAYIARVVTIGNGAIPVFGYEIAPFGLMVLSVILLALPETIDKLPFGPTRKN